jgi:hypothetical protein
MVKRIDILACEGTVEAMIEMYAIAYGEWFWTSFIPSPREITRKTFTGGYRCGFYLDVKVKSPLDIVWRDGSAARVLGEVLRPLTTGLFYMWAASTVWEALNIWSTLGYAMEACDWDGNTTTIANGVAPIQTNPTIGAPAFGEIIYDPRERGEPNTMTVSVGYETKWQAHVAGAFVATDEWLRNCRAGIFVNGEMVWLAEVGDVAPFTTKTIFVQLEGQTDTLIIQPLFYAEPDQITVTFGTFICNRFIVNAFPPAYPVAQPNLLPTPDEPANPLCHYYE